MSDSREVILGRIRQALQTAYLPDASPILPPEPLSRTSLNHEGRETMAAEWIDSFSRSLEAVGGEVIRVAGETEARDQLIELIRHSNTDAILAWPDEEMSIPMCNTLAAEGITVLPARIDNDAEVRHRQLDEMEKALIGVTGATAGLADTGSLALLSGERRPMTTSLLPLIHVAILREGDIVPDMAAFLAQHPTNELTSASRNLVFITGPSRTADIEMILTRGVHGPKRLVVLLLAEETRAA